MSGLDFGRPGERLIVSPASTACITACCRPARRGRTTPVLLPVWDRSSARPISVRAIYPRTGDPTGSERLATGGRLAQQAEGLKRMRRALRGRIGRAAAAAGAAAARRGDEAAGTPRRLCLACAAEGRPRPPPARPVASRRESADVAAGSARGKPALAGAAAGRRTARTAPAAARGAAVQPRWACALVRPGCGAASRRGAAWSEIGDGGRIASTRRRPLRRAQKEKMESGRRGGGSPRPPLTRPAAAPAGGWRGARRGRRRQIQRQQRRGSTGARWLPAADRADPRGRDTPARSGAPPSPAPRWRGRCVDRPPPPRRVRWRHGRKASTKPAGEIPCAQASDSTAPAPPSGGRSPAGSAGRWKPIPTGRPCASSCRRSTTGSPPTRAVISRAGEHASGRRRVGCGALRRQAGGRRCAASSHGATAAAIATRASGGGGASNAATGGAKGSHPSRLAAARAAAVGASTTSPVASRTSRVAPAGGAMPPTSAPSRASTASGADSASSDGGAGRARRPQQPGRHAPLGQHPAPGSGPAGLDAAGAPAPVPRSGPPAGPRPSLPPRASALPGPRRRPEPPACRSAARGQQASRPDRPHRSPALPPARPRAPPAPAPPARRPRRRPRRRSRRGHRERPTGSARSAAFRPLPARPGRRGRHGGPAEAPAARRPAPPLSAAGRADPPGPVARPADPGLGQPGQRHRPPPGGEDGQRRCRLLLPGGGDSHAARFGIRIGGGRHPPQGDPRQGSGGDGKGRFGQKPCRQPSLAQTAGGSRIW